MNTETDHLIRSHKDYLEGMKAESGDKFALRYKEIKRRFKELGYRVGDFPEDLQMHKLVRRKTKLTDQAWNKIRVVLEPDIQFIHSTHELMARVRQHFLVTELYAQYLFNQIPPIEWKFMPQVYSVCRLPELAALVEADRDRAITLADFAACMDGLGKSLFSAYEETRTRLRARVLAANDPFFDSDLTETQRFMDLEVATIVFRCGRCKYGVFGWDDIRSHRCDEPNFLGLYLNSHP